MFTSLHNEDGWCDNNVNSQHNGGCYYGQSRVDYDNGYTPPPNPAMLSSPDLDCQCNEKRLQPKQVKDAKLGGTCSCFLCSIWSPPKEITGQMLRACAPKSPAAYKWPINQGCPHPSDQGESNKQDCFTPAKIPPSLDAECDYSTAKVTKKSAMKQFVSAKIGDACDCYKCRWDTANPLEKTGDPRCSSKYYGG